VDFRAYSKRLGAAILAMAAVCLVLAPGASAIEWLGQYGVGYESGSSGAFSSNIFGIGVAPDGTVVASDPSASRVELYSQSGRFLRAFGKDVSLAPGEGPEVCSTDCKYGSSSSEAGGLASPYGIAVGPSEIYVAEQSNHRVSVFDYQGHFLRAFGKNVGGLGVDVCTTTCASGTSSPEAGALSSIYGLALDAAGELFVADPGNYRVDVFNAQTGQFIRAFGRAVGGPGVNVCTATCGPGQGSNDPGALEDPYGVAIGPEGDVYVADEGNSRVSVFDTSGQFLRSFGSIGAGAGNLEFPYAVAVSPNGTVYVADTNNYRLSVFNSDGSFRDAMGWNVNGNSTGAGTCTAPCQQGTPEYGIGAFNEEFSIATDCRGAVYVADYYRIDKYGDPAARRPPCESNAFSFGSISKNKTKGTLTAVVKVPGAGSLSVDAGSKLTASAPQPVGPGDVQVTIKAAGKGVKSLAKSGKLKGSLTVSFAPPNEDPSTQSEDVQLAKKVKKHKKAGKHKGGRHQH
jgi:sugar lactone lactonase YvrE